MTMMDTIYLSPDQGRVPVATEADLISLISAGVLEENHFVDLKMEVKSGKGENKETARDLAQFALDSGTVIVGVQELDDQTLALTPQPLAGLAERIEQLAGAIPDPPLAIVTKAIPSASDPSVGYLLVHVPVSPAAPHMVDGKYLGRGDKTKRYLTHPEVVRHHQQHAGDERSGLTQLQAEFDRDLFDSPEREQAHGFWIAEPMVGRPEMLLSLTDVPLKRQQLLNFRNSGNQAVAAVLASIRSGGFSPDVDNMDTFDRRPAGAAMSTYGIDVGRRRMTEVGYNDREYAAELEINDNGGLRIYTSRLSRRIRSDSHQVVFEDMLVGLSHRLVELTKAAAIEANYYGGWVLGFGATGLLGTHPYRSQQDWGSRTTPYGENLYQRTTLTSYADLTARPGPVVDRLIGGILRGFSSRQRYLPALIAPDDSTI